MIPSHKKIAVLHPYMDTVGGAVKMMIFLSDFLQKNNTVTFYTLSYNQSIFPPREIKFIVKSYSSKKIGKYFSFLLIAFHIRKSDFVIVGNSPMHFVSVLSKVLFGSKAKIIWWNHHYPWYYSNNANLFLRLKRYIEKIVVKKIDRLVSNGKYLKKEIDTIWERNSYILSPILEKEFMENNNGQMTQKNILLSYGRRDIGKNAGVLFRTYEDLRSKISDLVLIIGGEGEDLEPYILKYKNNSNVKFLGRLDKIQILENLSLANVFLFPSCIDSFGIVQLEAMSSGVPVVSFKKSDIDEIVQNDINGFAVNSENEFIARTYNILSDSSLRKKLSLGSLETSQRFHSQSFLQQLENIFGF